MKKNTNENLKNEITFFQKKNEKMENGNKNAAMEYMKKTKMFYVEKLEVEMEKNKETNSIQLISIKNEKKWRTNWK